MFNLRALRILVSFAVLAGMSMFVASSAQAATADAGSVRFVKEAKSDFESYVRSPSPDQAQWMSTHFFRQKTYAPYFDSRTGWARNAWTYKDAYAVYADGRDSALASQVNAHPEWILRDGADHKLFIPWGCSGGTCPQYAGDIGNPGFRAFWIAQARQTLSHGYKGLFIDDVNMEFKVSNGNGDEVAPKDPRTGQAMTEQSWRRYMAQFMEEIRAAFPSTEIAHNPIWFSGHSDPYVARELKAADYINIERGVNDNFSRGGGQFGYETLLKHVDWLHAQGKKVIFDSYADDRDATEYNLASYFLINGSADGVRSDYRNVPDNWWKGYDVSLGAPKGGRYLWQGMFRRDFAKGFVLTNQPGSETQTVQTPGGFGPDGAVRNSVTLRASSGAIVLGADPTEKPAIKLTPLVNPMNGTVTPPAPPKTRPQGLPTPKPTRHSRKRIRKAVLIRGKVRGVKAGTRIRVELRRKSAHRWVKVRSARVKVSKGGRFKKLFRHLRAGRYTVKARSVVKVSRVRASRVKVSRVHVKAATKRFRIRH